MELDELSQSGIRRVANYSPYLDQLAGLASEMGLKQRSNLVFLEQCLNEEWSLGENTILSWAVQDGGMLTRLEVGNRLLRSNVKTLPVYNGAIA